MRTTQFMGLTEAAQAYIHDYAIHNVEIKCEYCGGIKEPSEPQYEETGEVTGMFGEPVHMLKRYKTIGDQFEEYVQADPWSSGPCIYLALRWSNNKKPIEETLWDEATIQGENT